MIIDRVEQRTNEIVDDAWIFWVLICFISPARAEILTKFSWFLLRQGQGGLLWRLWRGGAIYCRAKVISLFREEVHICSGLPNFFSECAQLKGFTWSKSIAFFDVNVFAVPNLPENTKKFIALHALPATEANKRVRAVLSGKTTVSYALQGVATVLSFAHIALVSRYAGVDIFGAISLIATFTMTISVLVSARTADSLVRFCGEGEIKKNDVQISKTIRWGTGIDLILGFVGMAIVSFFGEQIAGLFLKGYLSPQHIQMSSWIVLLLCLRGVPQGLLTWKGRIRHFNMIPIVETTCRFLGGIYLIKQGWLDVTYFCFLYIGAALVSTAYAWFAASDLAWRGLFHWRTPNTQNPGFAREYWTLSGNNFLIFIVKSLTSNLDQFIFSYFFTAHDSGIYQLIRKLATPLAFIAQPFMVIKFPRLVELHTAGLKQKLYAMIAHSSYFVLLMGSGYVFLLFLLRPIIFQTLAVPEFPHAGLITAGMCLGLLLNNLIWWGRLFAITVKPLWSLVINTGTLIFQATIGAYLIMTYQLAGAALNLILVHAFVFITYWIILIRYERS